MTAIKILIQATFLPIFTKEASDTSLLEKFLYTSMVKIVLILFVIEASEEIMAAINAANVNPNKPFGNSDIINGYA